MKACRRTSTFVFIFFIGLVAMLYGQTGGTIRGSITLKSKNMGLHNASVRIAQLGRVTDTKEDGTYEFKDVPPGTYDVIAAMPSMNGGSKSVTVAPGGAVTADFDLEISGIRQEITVTASGREELTLDAFQTVSSLDSLDLAQNAATSLGETLDNQPGVAKRSFGPGSSRPVIRGFDGDRILVLQDGEPAGGLGSQSGDHAEPVNTATLERLEVLKGPATLLYGSNAIGGVVNAVTAETDAHEHPHEGLQGFVTGFGGSNNNQAGGSASFTYGPGSGWRMFGNGGAQRAGVYHTAEGKVLNSQTHVSNVEFGFGRDTGAGFFSTAGGYDKGLYGVASEDATIDFRRYNARFSGGVKNIGGAIETLRLTGAYTDWKHAEIEDGAVGTTLRNKQFTYRGVFEQKQGGAWSGSFGFSGAFRDFEAIGEESLAPPTSQKSIAGFVLEEVRAGRTKFQLGGRFDHIRYNPDGGTQHNFTGLSGGAGMHVGLWEAGAFVANFTTSYRAPALEELFNNGPHPGNLAFEIGNEDLKRERSNGIDLALRHQNSQIHAEQTFFYYHIRNFVYLAPTGAVQEDLRVFNYSQATTRFVGAETTVDIGLHSNLWLNLGLDSVSARLIDTKMPLPRIPPIRGHAGLDIRYKGLSIRPEAQMADAQTATFLFEDPTAGYTVFNLRGSYSIPGKHAIHMLTGNFFNVGDRLYRNHVSFVKDRAPEIGRGVSFSYSMRFF